MNLIKKFSSLVLADVICLVAIAYVVFNNPTGFMCVLGTITTALLLVMSVLTATDNTKKAYSGTPITIADINQNEDIKILTSWKDGFGWAHAIIERQDGTVRYIYINPSQCESVVNGWMYRVKDCELISIKFL